jgi:hypothetical protein
VELDPRIVLGNLLADRTRAFVRFRTEGYEPVVVARPKLREASRALRFPDLRCSIDDRGLWFRWREGVGGLRLVSQDVRQRQDDDILFVPLERPRPERLESRHLERPRRNPAWIGEVIADLGFA